MPDDLVTVRVYRHLPEALFARTTLAGADIDSFICDEHISSLYGAAIGGLRLQVAASDADAASRLLDDPNPDSDAMAGLPSEFRDPRCPVCGSFDISPSQIDKSMTCLRCKSQFIDD